jgi:spore coat protein U-like protein
MTRGVNALPGVLGVLVLIIAVGLPGSAWAQSCTFTITNLNFGNIDLTANTVFNTTGTFTANCTGNRNVTVRVCPNIGDGSGGSNNLNPRFLLSGSNQLNYNLFQDSAHTTVWGSDVFVGNPPTINIALNNSGTGSATATVYAQVFAGQQTLPAGTYTSSFAGAHTLVAYDYSTVGNCATIGSDHGTAAPFTVTATDVTNCSVSATVVNFGSAGVLQAAVNASGTLTATCTSTAPYNIGLNAGTATGATVTTRKMTSGGATIKYSLYSNSARTTNWGNTVGTDTVSGTGSGLAQSYTVYGQVPIQTTPAPATYTDTIVATVTY